ncbi:MAG TPA: SDR family NAD(P)-dependent oxidoreductase [Tepidisphaeraceae bacterium]|nr:SDR family NAD(P)-dependent oxidoreductase [Tepidisphaeraceae bacterium]
MALLDGKIAFITGGASGIGKGTAKRFAQEGADVAIADMQKGDGQKVADQLARETGRRVIFFACDVSSPEQVKAAVDGTVKQLGRLDVVFANAGVNGVWAPIEELMPEEWDQTQAINLKGTYLTVHYAIPHLRKAGGGSVIITSSVNGNRTFSTAGASAYSTSKAGQVAFMKMAALELAQYDIRVNAVCPGAIHTNINDRTTRRHTDEVAIKVEFPEGSPGIDGGQGEPDEVADACVFLAGHLSRHVSGVEMYVDGGASLLR